MEQSSTVEILIISSVIAGSLESANSSILAAQVFQSGGGKNQDFMFDFYWDVIGVVGTINQSESCSEVHRGMLRAGPCTGGGGAGHLYRGGPKQGAEGGGMQRVHRGMWR